MLVRPPGSIATLPPAVPRPAAISGRADGTWAAARLDTAGDFDLGPSLLEVVMWLPMRHDQLERTLGAGRGATTVTMDRSAVCALLPDHRDVSVVGERVEVRGTAYPPAAFEGAGYHGARVVGIDGGLLVAVLTGG
jgi:hypothetical protein